MFNVKNTITTLFLLGIFVLLIFNLDKITNYTSKFFNTNPSITIGSPNTYYKDESFSYVKNTKDFIPFSKQDLLNIFYTILNSGYENFTFYCPSEYTSCLKDVEMIANDQNTITNIGNFVHPYNNFSNLKVETDSLGEVNITIFRNYNEETIQKINEKLDEIMNEKLEGIETLEDKVLIMHDYIIDNTSYDIDNESKHSSDAYGLFLEGKAKCSGYADALAIVLTRLGVRNFKVASDEHVWNALYLQGRWAHIDLTWDDPVVTDGITITDSIRHKFYMIDTGTLLSYDTKEHTFDRTVYIELY